MADKERLVRKIKLGDEAAFKELFDEYHRQLYGVAFTYLHNTELSEDAVQDVFIKLWDSRAKLDPYKSVEGFLFTIMKNHVLTMIRTDKRRIQKKIAYSFRKSGRGINVVEEAIIFSEYEEIFLRALEELPSGKREVFRLRSQDGLTIRQVAKELNIKENTVKSQYYEASKFIREYLREHAGIEDQEKASG
jgi:RNA polymerase sigma-70 factor (family 1)